MPSINYFWMTESVVFNLDQFGTFTNYGLIEAGPGTDISLLGAFAFEDDLTTIINNSVIIADKGGSIDIRATVHQSRFATINVLGGKVTLDGNVDGGTIVITSGTLAFGRLTRGPAPEGSGTTTPIAFLGSKGGVVDTGVVGITEVFNAARQDIAIFSPSSPFSPPPVQIADMHLTGRAYTAAEFSVQGSAIVFDPSRA